jgi:hypothetical protein
MDEQPEKDVLIIKLALEKKLITQQQVDQCKDLAKKSKKIGLEATIEEILVKQGIVSQDQLDDLKDMCQLAEGGTVFGLYRLGKLIGQGGMGKVYEAVHEIMGRSVAIKVINAQITDDKNNATRFIQEIRALSKLNHPNIGTIIKRLCGFQKNIRGKGIVEDHSCNGQGPWTCTFKKRCSSGRKARKHHFRL